MGKLNALKVKTAGPGKHEDGYGLRLVVSPSPAGAKKWVLRITVGGKRREMGLGSFPAVSLAEARENASDARRIAKAGGDPISAREPKPASTVPTFTQAAAAYIRAHRRGWSNIRRERTWPRSLKTYAGPVIGKKPVDLVTTEDVLKILTPVWTTRTETASRVQGRIESVLDFAAAHKWRGSGNPARWRGHLDKLLPPPGRIKVVRHQPAIPYQEVSGFMAELRMMESVSARALEFLILTATRTSEVLGATWNEIDLAASVWTIPPGRMKGRREHRVPLSEAAKVEQDLGLAGADVDAAHLGAVDTFRFEEDRLLIHSARLIANKHYEPALEIITGRSHSFWVDRDVRRQAQWEACGLMAELGRELARIRPALAKMGTDPTKWFAAYTAADGWHRADALQRRLEAWVAKMDEEPEAEQALAVVRQEHEQLLRTMANGFAKALGESAWTVPGALHQTRVCPDVVETMGGRVAYFFVDAMRYEMGVELAHQIEGAKDLTVRAAVCALPSITPVGMAALLPGASASFDVVDAKGKLAARIEGTDMPGLNERLKFLKAKVPDVVEMTLGKLLSSSPAKVSKDIGKASLVVIRSQEIDFVGEMDGDLLARQVMDTVIGNLARAVKKLAAAGVEHFVITADHGHQFSVRKEDDMKTDNPRGDTLDLHRRCWIGHGGSTPTGAVRVSGADLGYHTDLDFVFPTGLGVFRAEGGLSFHHGGFSLQELVIPVISLRMGTGKPAKVPGVQVRIEDCPAQVTNRTFGIKLAAAGDLLTTEPLALRVLLMAGAQEVGRAGMAVGGEFDRGKGMLTLDLGSQASVGMMLTDDQCKSLRVVVLDARADGVLAESEELPVKLGI